MKLLRKLAIGGLALTFTMGGAISPTFAESGNAHNPEVMAHPPIHMKHQATSTYKNGYSPKQIRNAYGVDELANTGKGQTIAIVDAYGSPTIRKDLKTFDQQFGLSAADLTIAYPDGKPHKKDEGWALETSMDVEWAHAMAPDAEILLVVAKSNSLTDLLAAEDYATSHGAEVVSNSWGASEFSSESSYDAHFQHNEIAYTASSGDSGAGVIWPAAAQDVVAVGGTTLKLGSGGNRLSAAAWDGSGGGRSNDISRPSYQDNWQSVVGDSRGIPDISFDADPNTGVAVYDSTRIQGQKGWFQVGGTSLGAPCWAALIALADEGRASALSSEEALTKIYQIAGDAGSSGYSNDYYDIRSGNNGGFQATSGYDLVTGIGSPKASQLIPALSQ
ncbi:MAG TPA: S53 family peptidase [Bacillales bacterium]|nr:S53 family peptidase [Bacillales bacterium]